MFFDGYRAFNSFSKAARSRSFIWFLISRRRWKKQASKQINETIPCFVSLRKTHKRRRFVVDAFYFVIASPDHWGFIFRSCLWFSSWCVNLQSKRTCFLIRTLPRCLRLFTRSRTKLGKKRKSKVKYRFNSLNDIDL